MLCVCPFLPTAQSHMLACSDGVGSEAGVQVTTERMIRQQLQDATGVDLTERKAFVRAQVLSGPSFTLSFRCNEH